MTVLTQREIANLEKATFTAQKEAQLNRIAMEKQAGPADRQRDLAGSEVDITIKENRARARQSEADGEAPYIEQTGGARGAKIEAVGLARAKGFEAQKEALGAETTALVNVISALVKSANRFVPDIPVTGSNGVGGAMSAGVMGFLRGFQRQHNDRPGASSRRRLQERRAGPDSPPWAVAVARSSMDRPGKNRS